MDFFSGLAVSGIGHALPSVVAAVRDQAARLMHTSNLYYTEPAAKLAEELCRRSFAGKVFFSNSGSEANECAIKLARRFGWKRQGRFEIIVFENGFHGRTLGSLAATAQPKFHEGFGPLPAGFPVAKMNDLRSVERLIGDKTVAILIEPIQGEGGIHAATKEFLQGRRALADRSEILLIFDEVQCGLGRTGQLFAYQSYGVQPDILTLAKGLGGGMPIAATLVKPELSDLLSPGDHGTTFGGNPVSCAAARAVLKLLSPALLKKVRKDSADLLDDVKALVANHARVKEVRGLGFMIGVELTVPGAPFVKTCREKGLLINCTQGNTLRFLPPLALTPEEKRFCPQSPHPGFQKFLKADHLMTSPRRLPAG